jgi:hypothetical protein
VQFGTLAVDSCGFKSVLVRLDVIFRMVAVSAVDACETGL